MNTTGLVMTVTDELLADIEAAAGNAHIARSGHDWFSPEDCHWWTGNADEGDFISMANPSTITALTAELRRLRAENAGLAQSLAESRANDQAAMGWLTSLRWASGDRGERMLPELVTHIEGLAKDAGRYRWIAKRSTYGIDSRQRPSLTLPIYAPDHIGSLGVAIDTAMTAQ